jgi:hypothetical protein
MTSAGLAPPLVRNALVVGGLLEPAPSTASSRCFVTMRGIILSMYLLRLRLRINQSVRRRSNEIHVECQVRESCPRCFRETIELTSVEPHPSRTNLMLQNFDCDVCGPVKTRVVKLLVGDAA